MRAISAYFLMYSKKDFWKSVISLPVSCSVWYQISKESEEFIVEQYKRLRQRDGSGVTKSAWRITVRQLESLIRLSESMARMHCCDEVCERDKNTHDYPRSSRLSNINKINIPTTQCDIFSFFQVQPKHVKEAFRLLNKSIIRVETPDINLDQEEEEAMEEEEEQMNGRIMLYFVRVLTVVKITIFNS